MSTRALLAALALHVAVVGALILTPREPRPLAAPPPAAPPYELAIDLSPAPASPDLAPAPASSSPSLPPPLVTSLPARRVARTRLLDSEVL